MNLYEYQNEEQFKGDLTQLESFLEEVWENRDNVQQDKNETSLSQRFLDISFNKKLIKNRNYVGVIHYGEHTLNLLPKIFYESGQEEDTQNIQSHLFWWLGYCKRIKFPKYLASTSSMKHDLFEVLIYHFAKYTRELLNSAIFRQYQELSE